MDLSSERLRIVLQLSDMFAGVSEARILQVCEENSFNIELCIDQLIATNENPSANEANRFIRAGKQGNTIDSAWSTICRTQSYEKDTQQGAIPKCSISQSEEQPDAKHTPHHKGLKISSENKKSFTPQEQKILEQIRAGYRVMVIMRGAPGCGKSYLANALLRSSIEINDQYKPRDFICAADDFFFNNRGHYKYNVEQLSDAHYFNQRRVSEKAANGWSPIFIDNTNMKLWEMLPYVKAAVQYGYILEILEPNTPWNYSPAKLAMKNRHRVPKEKIQIMLDKYERGTVADLFKMLKDTKYSLPLPQIRNHPPLVIQDDEMDTNENFQDFDIMQNIENSSDQNTLLQDSVLSSNDAIVSDNTKPQKETIKCIPSSKIALKLSKEETEIEEKNNNALVQDPPPLVWKPYEQEANLFWGLSLEDTDVKLPSESSLHLTFEKSEKTLLDLLKEGVNELPSKKIYGVEQPEQVCFQRHKVNCPNENKSFISLRQIYPNKQLSGLWDLFVKCNGDIDWAVDILLKEDELSTGDNQYNGADDEDNECRLTCNCDSLGDSTPNAEIAKLLKLSPQITGGNIKPQRIQKVRTQRFCQNPTGAQLEVKEAIENNFVLGDEFYSHHLRKIKKLRNGNAENAQPAASPRSFTDAEVQTDPIIVADTEDDMENDDNGLLEINLGEEFVKQLSGTFSTEIFNFQLPENLKTNVFMPKTLAKELFMLWMESAYNQIEEKRQIILREDEEFAHLLKNPKYEHCKEIPKNVKEILDMELACMIYKKEQDEQNQFDSRYFPTDIASHLTQMKLCELFPNIPRETLLDIFAAHGNQFNETIEVLQSTMNSGECTTNSQEQLLQRAIQENEQLHNQKEALQGEQYENNYAIHSINSCQSTVKSQLLPEESKRIALREFEDTRNFAAHHCQLKAECYQKAKDAIQKGNSGVAVYYSQIANLHKKKIDMYNHRAANCIMEVHKYTQNNPDLLDLHYLYVLEAVGCLDLFLDRHITNLRTLSKSYKHVFIITGRGLHSAGGVSTIKNKVKSRLKERSLRWSEVNPGLLKVKIFSASRYSKNI